MTMEKNDKYIPLSAVNNLSKGWRNVYKIFGLLVFILGLVNFSYLLIEKDYYWTIISPIGNIILGFYFFSVGFDLLHSKTAEYIRFNEKSIEYKKPGLKKMKTININEIEKIEIKLLSVCLKNKTGEEVLNLNKASYKNVQKAKMKFEELAGKENIEITKRN